MDDLRLNDRVEALARVEPAPLPLLSLYLNTEPTGNGRPTYETFLRKELPHRVTTYQERSAERDSLEQDRARIEQYLAEQLQPSSRGLALFACAGRDLFEAIQLQVPFDRHQLVVSDRPFLYPLARLDDEHPRYAAVVVDTNAARIFVFSTGQVVDAVDVQNAKTKHIKAGGWSQARFQRHVENLHLHHAKEVVERLDQIVAADDIDHIVLAGDEVIVPLLKEHLPERLTSKLVDVVPLDIRSPEHQVLSATLEALRRSDEASDDTVVRQLIDDYRAGGLAVVGVQPVLEAFERGQVDTLIISATPTQLTGGEDTANRLVTLAHQTSAAVRFIENPDLLAAVGGVGASLRFLI
jgi:peptide chain release factor subunit 1